MNTRLCFLSALLLITILTGCSLTPDGSSGESAGLRLLQTGGGTTALSSKDFDDWSPQMVRWQGTNYLYFLSTRGASNIRTFDNGTWIISNKPAGTVGIFRTEYVTSGVFKNLELYYSLPPGENFREISVISNFTIYEIVPTIFAYHQTASSTNVIKIIGNLPVNGGIQTNSFTATPPIEALGGSWTTTDGTSRLIAGYSQTQSIGPDGFAVGIDYTAVRFYGTGLNSNSPEGNALLQIKAEYDPLLFTGPILENWFSQQEIVRYNSQLVFRGVCPAVFQVPGTTNKRFGFYVSANGILHQMVYREYRYYTDFYIDSRPLSSIIDSPDILDKQRIIPLITVTHQPGSIDKNPSYDPGTGLYFSSDRSANGNFDLYYVPKDYLGIPQEILLPPFFGGM